MTKQFDILSSLFQESSRNNLDKRTLKKLKKKKISITDDIYINCKNKLKAKNKKYKSIDILNCYTDDSTSSSAAANTANNINNNNLLSFTNSLNTNTTISSSTTSTQGLKTNKLDSNMANNLDTFDSGIHQSQSDKMEEGFGLKPAELPFVEKLDEVKTESNSSICKTLNTVTSLNSGSNIEEEGLNKKIPAQDNEAQVANVNKEETHQSSSLTNLEHLNYNTDEDLSNLLNTKITELIGNKNKFSEDSFSFVEKGYKSEDTLSHDLNTNIKELIKDFEENLFHRAKIRANRSPKTSKKLTGKKKSKSSRNNHHHHSHQHKSKSSKNKSFKLRLFDMNDLDKRLIEVATKSLKNRIKTLNLSNLVSPLNKKKHDILSSLFSSSKTFSSSSLATSNSNNSLENSTTATYNTSISPTSSSSSASSVLYSQNTSDSYSSSSVTNISDCSNLTLTEFNKDSDDYSSAKYQLKYLPKINDVMPKKPKSNMKKMPNLNASSNFRLDEDINVGRWKMRETLIRNTNNKAISSYGTNNSYSDYNSLSENINRTITNSNNYFFNIENFTNSAYLSTSSSSSSSSSFSSISEFSNQNSMQKRPKSVALCYYHHLFNEKQKLLNKNYLNSYFDSSINNLQPLYRLTYRNSLIKNNKAQLQQNKKANIQDCVASYKNKIFRQEANQNFQQPLNRTVFKPDSKNTKTTQTSATSSLSPANLSSLINSDIKQVKFKNYGLHKSLGENLDYLSESVKNNCSGKINKKLHRKSENFLNSNYEYHDEFEPRKLNYDDEDVKDYFLIFDRNSKSISNVCNDEDNYKIRNRNANFNSRLRKKEMNTFKSCSPPRRRSNYDTIVDDEAFIQRTLKSFDKYSNLNSSSCGLNTRIKDVEINARNLSSKKDLNSSSQIIEQIVFSKPSATKPIQITIDTKNLGGGLITADIKLNEQRVKFDLRKIDDTKYELKLVPSKVGTYQVYMFLNGDLVKGSPFLIKIDSLNDIKDIKKIIPNSPIEKEIHSVQGSINNNNFDLPSCKSSLKTEIFDFVDQSELFVGKPVKLDVNIMEMNKAPHTVPEIKSIVKYNGRLVSHKLERISNGLYQLSFLPLKSGYYHVNFYKNGQKIEGSPFKLFVKGKLLNEIIRPNFAQVGLPYILTLDYYDVTNLKVNVYTENEKDALKSLPFSYTSSSLSSTAVGTILSSTKKINYLQVEKIIDKNNKLRIKFVPLEPVEHIIDIVDNGISIESFPIRLNVFPSREIFLTSDLLNGIKLGGTCKFKVHLNGQKDSLDFKVLNIDIGATQNISFLLNDEYEQAQHVFGALCKFLRLSSNRIKNFELKIENGKTRVAFSLVEDLNQVSNSFLLKELKTIIDEEKYVIIDLSIHKTVKAVKGSFKYGPKGEKVNFKLEKKFNKTCYYIGEFKPQSVGRYRIDITNLNVPINNSPYFINVYDPQSIEIIKRPDEFIVGNDNLIDVDLSMSSFFELKVKIQSPSGGRVPFKFDNDSSIKRLRIIPTETGVHRVSIKLGDHHIKNSPFEISAIEPSAPCVYGDGLYNGIQNEPVIFYVNTPNNIDGNLNIDIKDPKEVNVKTLIEKISENLYEIKYMPDRIGTYKIIIHYNDKEIINSPFSAKIVNPNRVKIIGEYEYFFNSSNTKIFDFELNSEKCFSFDTSEAGPGTLKVDILSPINEKLPYKKICQEDIHKLYFTPVYEGQYKLNFTYNNFPISISPIIALTSDYSILKEIRVYGNGICKAELHKESEFFVDCSRIKDLEEFPEISFMGFSNDLNNLKINIASISKNVYRCNYIPEKPGQYLINIKFNKIHVSGSPFEIKIGNDSDIDKIKINKDDFKSGFLGEEIKTIIDTRTAGPGELTANCIGTTKAALCEFVDQKNGTYLLKIKPQEVGKHILQIKYNDEHVEGSPFSLRISQPPDANKVKVTGPGIFHGVLSKFESKFICDTKGAGAGQLTVRIRGPKGAFRVDMQRKDDKDRQIMCKYDPLEVGEYQINVKWSGKHVPNSPFNVNIFNKDEELEAYLKENPKELILKDLYEIEESFLEKEHQV